MAETSGATNGRPGVLTAAVGWLFGVPDRIPIKHRRMYAVGRYCSVFALCGHILYLAWFGLLHVATMYLYNYVSVFTFAIVFLLFQREAYFAAILIGACEFIVHQTLAVFCIGWDGGFQYLLIVLCAVPFLVVPYARFRRALFVSALCFCVFLILLLFLRTSEPAYAVPKGALRAFEFVNLLILSSCMILMSSVFVYYVKKAEDKADYEFERAEGLLRNILPDPIAERLKTNPSSIADGFDCVTVLFADIVDFTVLSGRLAPEQVVSLLNDLFSRFDLAAEKRGLEKIKTIGDCYMVASGIPERKDCTAEPVAEFALDIQEEIARFNRERGTTIRMRIGINSGPVVAGVIGKRKFIYDLWGDAVNTASRMESHGVPGQIQVTKDSFELLKNEFQFEDRGEIEVKGKGRVNTFILLGRKTAEMTLSAPLS